VAQPDKGGFFTTLLRTHDGGRSWRPLGFSATVRALTFDAVHPSLLYGFGSGVERSIDGGQTWTPLGLAGFSVSSFAVDPRDGQTLLAAVASSRSAIKPAMTSRIRMRLCPSGPRRSRTDWRKRQAVDLSNDS